MSTRKLAKELGLLRQRSRSSSESKKSLVSNQIFSYLIVIDFESTCWKEKNNYSQEIIEFPAVLLNTSSGQIESEFHTYVQPQERPTLSAFCTELTGITQMQVEAGIPLQICLSRFCRWLQSLQLERGVVFPNKQQRLPAPSPSPKLCTFLTWSDWDLGVCLQYECKRKQLHKPDVLNSWIDLRSTYRLFYSRKPKGLNGALQDVGIQFSGREHSGLDDARNTAKLAVKMMRDGCMMKITRSLERTPPVSKPLFGHKNSDKKQEKSNTGKDENTITRNKPSSSKNQPTSCELTPCPERNILSFGTEGCSMLVQESAQSLIKPKTILNTTTPMWGHRRTSVTTMSAADFSSSLLLNTSLPHSKGNKGLILCSTTLGSLSHLPQTNEISKNGSTVHHNTDVCEEFFVETEEREGSYDDVVIEGDHFRNEMDGECGVEYTSDFDSGRCVEEDSGNPHLTEDQVTPRDNLSTKTSRLPTTSVNKSRTDHLNKTEPLTTLSDNVFAVPKVVNWGKINKHKIGHKTPPQIQDTSSEILRNNTSTLFTQGHKTFNPGKASTPNTLFAKPKPFTQNTKQIQTPKSSFIIYTDPLKRPEKISNPRSCHSLNFPKNVLCPLSTNTNSLCHNRSSITETSKKGQKITSPLCACGRRAKHQVVSNGGPNHGRGFFCCPVRRSDSGGRIQKGCEFFKWELSLMQSSAAASPAAMASVSAGRINSTFNCGLRQRSTFRKSY